MLRLLLTVGNCNIIPWWLLLPQGVSGAIKKKAGTLPFKEVAKYGAIPLGEARSTHAGKLNYQGIIHVAGINMFWVASEYSVINSVKNAIVLATEKHIKSLAMPLIGSGNRGKRWSLKLIENTLKSIDSDIEVTVVTYGLT